MATRTIDILLNMEAEPGSVAKTSAGVKKVERSLKDVETQANRTRDKMEKLAQVGNRLAMMGGAIVAPFALAMKKYLDTTKETEPTSRRLLDLSKKWEESQVRIGRVTAEIVLPALETALNVVDKIAAFAEAHPDAVKAALGIGASMVLIGGALSTVGSIVSMLATIQGLAAGAGLATGTATAGAGGAAAVTAGITSALPAIGAGLLAILTSPLTWAVAALVLIKPLMNWLLGTDTTWKEIGQTGKQALIIIGYGIDKLLKGIGGFFANIGTSIWSALQKAATFMVEGIGGAVARLLSLIPGKAEGGMIGSGLFVGGERGREFVMSNQTTRAAENVIGGQLTQQSLLAGLAGGKRISYYDSRHIDSRLSNRDRQFLVDDLMTALGVVVK